MATKFTSAGNSAKIASASTTDRTKASPAASQSTPATPAIQTQFNREIWSARACSRSHRARLASTVFLGVDVPTARSKKERRNQLRSGTPGLRERETPL